MTALRLGANRAISAAQLASSEAGATRRRGLRLSPAFVLQHQQQRQHLDRLAEPHVVGKAGPKPEPREQVEPLHARLLIGPQRALKVLTGIDARKPIGMAQGRQRLRQPRTGHGLAPVDVGCPRRHHRQCRRRPACASPRRTTGHRWRRGARSPRIAPASGSVARDRPRPICRGSRPGRRIAPAAA